MSQEENVLKSFGVSHIKDLVRVNVAHPRFGMVPTATKAAVMELKKDIDISRFIAQMFYGSKRDEDLDNEKGIANCRELLETDYAKQVDLGARIKSFSSTGSGAGDEWVPTLISDTYLDELMLEKMVPTLFRQIPMQSNPFKMPLKSGSTVGRLVAEGAAGTDTNWTTSDVQFDAKKFYEYFLLPEELNEDSAPAILDIAKREVSESVVRAWERAILDGDTTGTHMDSDVTAASDARKAFIGLRKKALANTGNATVTFTSAVAKDKLLDMRALMGKYGVAPRELAWIMSPSAYNQTLALAEVMTVDKVGQSATILQGALSSIFGIPIVVSEYMREDLNASGVYDGTTTNNTAVLLVNHRRFMLGMRRPIRVKVAMDARAEYDRWQLVSYARVGFNGAAQSSSEVSVVIGIDVTA